MSEHFKLCNCDQWSGTGRDSIITRSPASLVQSKQSFDQKWLWPLAIMTAWVLFHGHAGVRISTKGRPDWQSFLVALDCADQAEGRYIIMPIASIAYWLLLPVIYLSHLSFFVRGISLKRLGDLEVYSPSVNKSSMAAAGLPCQPPFWTQSAPSRGNLRH